jgi:hypothetical protein
MKREIRFQKARAYKDFLLVKEQKKRKKIKILQMAYLIIIPVVQLVQVINPCQCDLMQIF